MAADRTQSFPRLLVVRMKHYGGGALERYRNLSTHSKLFVWGTICLYIALGSFIIIVGPDRIGQTLYNFAQKISHYPYGWLILTSLFFIVSFPPAVGHTTLVTLCGYAYGMKGFPIAASGSLLGSAFTFVVLRLLFRRRLRKWTQSSEKWQALETVIAAKGLPLIMLIRASPFPPWVYSNALFASIQSVALWQFFLATFVVFPKIAIFVFVGSRLASLSDGEQRSHMDTTTKILNISISVGGVLVAAVASWIIYRLMKKEILHLQGVPPEIDELAAEAIEEAEEGAPLLGHHSESRARYDVSSA
ncbi:Golgi apparatus membrane protein TVP38 [Polyporus arcularius HHB13444]|uniref:Golgi apparatus membrane protein TVP38 n=1 Tax=Polyporus arcularius HHB13444 TaxID=1314778 RepID=A0A5C3PYB8_9APHY|nr:Golgi apparatus membrane protein TVP38 [Polyporus arcularius HHB13444]